MIRQDELLNMPNKLSGFLLTANSVKKLATTKVTGYSVVINAPTKYASLFYWHGEKETVSWNLDTIFMKGNPYPLPEAVSSYYIHAAAATRDKIILLMRPRIGAGFYLFFCNKAFTTVLAQSNILSGVYDITTTAQFNKTATKLVFIGRTAALDNTAVPFDTTLNNYTSGGYSTAFTGMFYTQLGTDFDISNIGSHKQTTADAENGKTRWNAVYRVTIDPVNNTASVSATPQYCRHVFKVVENSSWQSSQRILKYPEDPASPYSQSWSMNESLTVSDVHIDPYLTNIYFDKNNIERTESISSAFTMTLTASGSYAVTDGTVEDATGSQAYAINAEISYTAQSALGSYVNRVKKIENVSITKNAAPPLVITKSQTLESETVNNLLAFNPYLHNAVIDKIEYTFAVSQYQSDNNNIALDVTAHRDISTAVSAMPFVITAPADTVSQSVFCNWLTGPSYGVWSASATNDSAHNEYFVFIDATTLFSNIGVIRAHCDRHNNSMYLLSNNYVEPTQYSVKIYKALFAAETAGKQAEIAAIVTNPNNLIGVI